VKGLTNVIRIAGGRDHSLAIEGNGSVWAWGWNQYGQVGDGTKTNRLTPVKVGGLPAAARQVAAGANHSLARLSNGTVWAWGQNRFGQVGDGTGVGRLTPVKVAGIANAVNIGAGRLHSLVIEKDRSVWAWGDNDFGQLGDGTTTNRMKPVRVVGLTGGEQVAGGRDYSVALVRP
jgi:alpha-tubulin suppressor-like RCC1 family protein